MPASKHDLIADHLRTMRIVWTAFFATAPVALVAGFFLPRLRAQEASPAVVTLLALAGCLWVSLTADRDARIRLDRAKRAFAVHGDLHRLLGNHRTVFLVVLLRLEVLVICAVMVAVWGRGPMVGVWFALLASVMIGLTWPSERKTRLLVDRAEQLRGDR